MKDYKYIHIFWRDEILFTPNAIDSVDSSPYFISNDHLFVITSDRIYKKCPYDNVVLDKEFGINKGCHKLINKYAEFTNFLFVHSLCDPIELLYVKKRNICKIIWRSWGHDAFFPYKQHKGRIVSNFGKRMIEYIWKKRIRSFCAICGANIIDEISLKETFGKDIRYFVYTYTNLSLRPKRSSCTLKGESSVLENKQVKVLIGHSGYENDNHIEILEKLKVYKEYNIHLFLVLAYGDSEYIKNVRNFALEHWKEKVTIIENLIPREEYVKFIDSIDIAILDGCNSYALGNIRMLIAGKKKIVVNQNGVIRKAFDEDCVPYLLTNSAFSLPFDEFSKPFFYPENAGVKIIPTFDDKVQSMKYLFLNICSIRQEL